MLWKRLWITRWIGLPRAETRPCPELSDSSGQGLAQWAVSAAGRYFHCVETPNPAAMKPKPTTMFQLPRSSMGNWPSVT